MGTHCPKLQMAQEIAVNAVEKGMNGSRPTKQLLLRFPASFFFRTFLMEVDRSWRTIYNLMKSRFRNSKKT